MNMLAFIFAANTQHVDVIGPILKPLVPFLVLAAIIKVATSFIPKKRRHSQHTKAHNKSLAIRHHGERDNTRKAKRTTNFLFRMIMTGFVGLFIIICAIAFGSGLGMFIWICIGLLLDVSSIIRIYAFFNKGKMGELLVMTRLRKGLPVDEYDILNNIYLPIGGGATTQIDHVVVSRFGVFVVETKNYSGWIFADASSKVWTQTIYHAKNTFQNPIRQNYRHVCAIADNLRLPKEYIRGVVAFTGNCEFKTPIPDGVVYSRKLADYIKSFASPILKEQEKAEILLALREWDASVTPQQRASHVDNLRQSHN